MALSSTSSEFTRSTKLSTVNDPFGEELGYVGMEGESYNDLSERTSSSEMDGLWPRLGDFGDLGGDLTEFFAFNFARASTEGN